MRTVSMGRRTACSPAGRCSAASKYPRFRREAFPTGLYVAAPASVQAVVDHHVWLVPSNHPVKLLRLLHTGIVRPTAVEPE